MLEVDNLQFAYGDAVALRDISFEIEAGEIVTLLGSNGAGKSTTVNNVSGVLTPDQGTVTYQGEEITGTPVHETVEMGMKLVPEHRGIFSNLTVEKNLNLGLRLIPEAQREERRDYVFDLFPRLRERLNQQAGSLSGGEQQMLAMGLGLTADPDLLVLDEPSLGLMPTLVETIFSAIETINEEGVTILLVEQQVFNALEVSDRAYIVENGETTITGEASDLIDDDRIRERYLAAQ